MYNVEKMAKHNLKVFNIYTARFLKYAWPHFSTLFIKGVSLSLEI